MSEDAPGYGGRILRVKIGDREMDATDLKRVLRDPWSSWPDHLEALLFLLGLPRPQYIRESESQVG